MTATYITKDFEVLDKICLTYYKQKSSSSASNPSGVSGADQAILDDLAQMVDNRSTVALNLILKKVIEANPGLADFGAILPGGVEFTIPNMEASDLIATSDDTEVSSLAD